MHSGESIILIVLQTPKLWNKKIDAGTKPSGTSLHALYKCFEKNKNVGKFLLLFRIDLKWAHYEVRLIGGCCGEITVDVGRGCSNLLNPLVASQNFECKIFPLAKNVIVNDVGKNDR